MTPEIHAGNNVTHDLGRGSKLQYELLNYLISLLLAVKKIVLKCSAACWMVHCALPCAPALVYRQRLQPPWLPPYSLAESLAPRRWSHDVRGLDLPP